MLLQRVYDADGKTVTGVRIKDSGSSPGQNWAARQVEQYMGEGWMQVRGEQIVITSVDGEELVYDILRRPGYYCASTGERIPISEPAMLQFMSQPQATLAPAEARAWLAERKRGGGYEATRNYSCALVADAHAKYRAVVGPKGQIAAAHRLEG